MNLTYIDPASGSMILQILLGGLAAAAVFLKLFWHRLLVLLRIRKPTTVERPAEEADTTSPPAEHRALERRGERVGER
ncbi:MAG: hypothetical protein M3N24_07730 [Actinomycetota bacterium]|nr:hypothetical protein [Actinomycetota bacterium]